MNDKATEIIINSLNTDMNNLKKQMNLLIGRLSVLENVVYSIAQAIKESIADESDITTTPETD